MQRIGNLEPMEIMMVKTNRIPNQENWLMKLRGPIVPVKELEAVRQRNPIDNNIVGFVDVIVEFPQRKIRVKRMVKEQVVSFNHGLLCGGKQADISWEFKKFRRRAGVAESVEDIQVSMEFINFRTW